MPSGRLRVIAIAMGCITLGWLMTSALGPSDAAIPEVDLSRHGLASAGVLNDPSGFGAANIEGPNGAVAAGHNTTSGASGAGGDSGGVTGGSPTIKGALGDLHKAVSDKIQNWGGYGIKPADPQRNGTAGPAAGGKATNASAAVGEWIKDGLGEEERLGARTRVGKCTILFNGNTYYERAIRTHEQHDRMHGYRLHVLRQHLLDDVWSKPAYILSLLLRELAKAESERLEWLLWVDADTIILNPHIPIETFLPPAGGSFDDVHLLYSSDWNGLNNGVFPVRVNRWSVELFSAIAAYRYYRPEEALTFRDQSAMNTLMGEPRFAKNVMQLPQRWFNAYQGEQNETLAPYQIRRGDMLVHFAGVGNRDERMAFWLDRAEQHMEDWEVPAKSTSYAQEVKDFWAEQRGLREDNKRRLSEARLAATEALVKAESMMAEYKDRLRPDEAEAINKETQQMRKVLTNEKHADDLKALTEQRKKLDEGTKPLTAAASESHKLMSASAHEAIFAGERAALDGALYRGITDAEVEELGKAVKQLKELVMVPEEQWNRAAIASAADGATSARAKLETKVAALRAAEESAKKSKEEEEARARKALEQEVAEKKAALQAQLEKEAAAAAVAAEVTGATGGEEGIRDVTDAR